MTNPETTPELLYTLQRELSGKRALLIDRYPNARTSLRTILAALGIGSVDNASTSVEVLRLVRRHYFDLIVSDYRLEDGLDGQQLLELLRQQQLVPRSTVFLMITSERAYHNVVSVAELAPDDYLVKPFTTGELQVRLARALTRKRFFAPVYECMDSGLEADALAACERLIGQDSGFLFDALRIKGELLNALGRHAEAQIVYQQVLAQRPLPWARMGLGISLRGQQKLAEADAVGQSLVDSHPQFVAAYDFLAEVREASGKLPEAQQILQRASEISPNNATRLRMVGDVAARNRDLPVAEKAYGKVLERRRNSSLRNIDDYTNLARVMLERRHIAGARLVSEGLRRDWHGNRQGELAALVMESLCASQEGEHAKAKRTVAKALLQQDALKAEGMAGTISERLALDLAHACLASGDAESARAIVRKVAAENHEDRALIDQVQSLYARVGKEDEGRALLAQVGREIVELNNRGVLAARRGDFEGSVRLLVEAAERIPNLQFLVNATKAIFTLLDRRGWDPALAKRGLRFLQQAQAKDARSAKVASARELFQHVARKYGITEGAISTSATPRERGRG